MTAPVRQLSFDLAMGDTPTRSRRGPDRASAAREPRQLAFHLVPPVHSTAARRARGAVAFRAGLAAEDQVARAYARRGARLVAERWRGKAGEIDLILQDADGLVFVEVKRGRSHDAAIARVTPRQVERLYRAVEEYVGAMHPGACPQMRFDVATVDGTGEIAIRQNAFA